MSDKEESLRVGDVDLNGLRSIDVTNVCGLYEVRFSQFVAWQVVNESFTSIDEYELFEHTGLFCVLSRSRYLDHVNAMHGLYKDLLGLASHYRLQTLDEVIDVVACVPPTIQAFRRS